jgi:hypothetical protein
VKVGGLNRKPKLNKMSKKNKYSSGIFNILHENGEAVERADYPQFYEKENKEMRDDKAEITFKVLEMLKSLQDESFTLFIEDLRKTLDDYYPFVDRNFAHTDTKSYENMRLAWNHFNKLDGKLSDTILKNAIKLYTELVDNITLLNDNKYYCFLYMLICRRTDLEDVRLHRCRGNDSLTRFFEE